MLKYRKYCVTLYIYIWTYVYCELGKKGLLIMKMITIILKLIIYAEIIKYILCYV